MEDPNIEPGLVRTMSLNRPVFKVHGRGVPPAASWPHKNLLFRVASDVAMKCEGGMHIPLNPARPMPFETKLFEGEVVFRIKGAKNSAKDPWEPGGIYATKKRQMVFVVQGTFKKRLNFNDVKSMFECKRPLDIGFFARAATRTALTLIRAIQPGLEADILCDKPYVRNWLCTACDALSCTDKGKAPHRILGGEPPEELFPDRKQRRQTLKLESERKQRFFETNKIYTFGFHSDKLCFLDFTAKVPLHSLQLDVYLNGQPFPFEARTTDGQVLWKFELWHEHLLAKVPPEQIDRGLVLESIFTGDRRRSRAVVPGSAEEPVLEPRDLNFEVDDNDYLARLANLTAEQRLLRNQMNMMLRSPPKHCLITEAHRELVRLVDEATVAAANSTLQQGVLSPFDGHQTAQLLRLIIRHLAEQGGRQSPRSPKKVKKKTKQPMI
eukprot:TRINITY_DN2008_c1_g1_i1.p1 TRINITY_DN2008_c1_g1~~TRINITY_DN2008_c1_g1_i1.p1  ORF type:complete len:462 (+),score=74.42 TRINITY_DN2008_c1_g1_i1:74-1387(+)